MINDTSWLYHGICSGKTELFFPPTSGKEPMRDRDKREAAAMTVCRQCPVIVECRNYARENNELGIWGGENEESRWKAGFLPSAFGLNRRRRFTTRWKSVDVSSLTEPTSSLDQQKVSQ